MPFEDTLLRVSLSCHLASTSVHVMCIHQRALILFIQSLALYKSFTYLLTYLPATWMFSRDSSFLDKHFWRFWRRFSGEEASKYSRRRHRVATSGRCAAPTWPLSCSLSPEIGRDLLTKWVWPISTSATRLTSPVPTKWTAGSSKRHFSVVLVDISSESLETRP